MALALLIKRFQRTKWCLLTTDMISAAFVTWFIHNWNMNGCHEIICGLYGMDNDGIYDELIIYLKMCIHYLLFQFAKASADLNCFFRLGLLSWSWYSYSGYYFLLQSYITHHMINACIDQVACCFLVSMFQRIVELCKSFPVYEKFPIVYFVCMYIWHELKIFFWT